ncbi:MAG: lytic murein transglycosylase, partial [Hyphomicrobiaceae bacterium]|nr:lytic murein transglycosylase [Hyphomicrobiaceae bacterium]
MGNRSVTRSLATLAAVDARRPQLWRDELFAALAIIDKGDATVETMSGSWAGAMGHMQFMPSSFQKHAVDFDGDGRRDIWSNPGDALASAANFLKASGWVTGRAWGREVTLPGNFDLTLAAPNVGKTVTAWQMLGVRPTTGLIPLDDDPNWQIILPAGAKGPAFLVSSNFEVLLKYNRAMPYALAVGHLADRLAGGGAIAAAWPVDDIGLSKDEIGDVQRALAGFGHDPGPIDSIIGAQTRAAIRAFQQARQLPPDGHASLGLLRRLRNERRI